MSITYRSEKGSALTLTELDDNFRYFTGSHAITGSLTVSDNIILPSLPTSTTGLNTGSLWMSGSDGNGSSYLMIYNP